jgi:hypothetical protein
MRETRTSGSVGAPGEQLPGATRHLDESPKTTKLYDRTSDQITLDDVERIVI